MKPEVKWTYQNMLNRAFSSIAVKNGKMYIIIEGGLECELLTFEMDNMSFNIKYWVQK